MANATASTAAAKSTASKAAKSGAPKQEAGKPASAAKEKQAVNVVPKPVKKPVKKAVKAEKAAPVAKEKVKKPKLVRDSFTMPEAEYAVLGEVKKACLKAGIEVKKSELLRVGVALIRQLDTARLQEILAALPALKAGRPKKSR